MIVDVILNIAKQSPDKEAILYQGVSMNYLELADKVIEKTEKLKKSTQKVYLIQEKPIETIISLLALNKLRKAGIIIPLDFGQSQVFDLSKKWNEEVPVKNRFLGILSAGSTGDPKIIWKTNANWESAFEHQSTVFDVHSDDRVFVLDAMAYSANLNAALHTLWLGATLILGNLKQASNWQDQFLKERISSFFLVPSHCRLLCGTEQVNSSIKSMLTAGEKLDKNVARKLLKNFPNAQLTEYYGAAELGHISYHQNEAIILDPHSVGKAFPKVNIQVKEGKISVFSPFVSPDYKAIGSVNDLGYFEDNKLILQGRAGRMFNRRGLNIFAQEIENIALQNSLIHAAVLIQTDPKGKLTLFFTSKSDSKELNESLISKYLREKLPKAKQPNFIKELRELPHSEAGKIDFRALSKMSNEEKIMTV